MDFKGLHYNSIASRLKEQFGCRVVKLSLDAHLSCPNRDGTCGLGGCSFCSSDGSGTFASTIDDQISTLSSKWLKSDKKSSSENSELTHAHSAENDHSMANIKYIAYFQNHTNTYAPAEYLRKIWNDALGHKDIVGIAIATRPDCLGKDILDLLDEFNRKTFLWVELGLQTENEKTARNFNRGYENEIFELAMNNLSKHGIKTVIHLILGLPGEDKDQMIRSACYAASFNPFGVKLHMLHLLKDTRMGMEYEMKPWELMDMDSYISLVCDILELIPEEITVHRLTGDAPRDMLIAPAWTEDKHRVLNGIQQEFRRRGSFQGSRLKCE